MADLELRRDVRLTPRGGSSHGVARFVLLPASANGAATALERAAELGATPGSVALGGAERSFEAHFVPRSDVASGIVVSTKRLRGGVELLGTQRDAGGETVLRVRALAGTSFGELCRAVHGRNAEFMPFASPTAEAISLGGALAVNVHARTSSTHGGLFAERVRAFRLVAPNGATYDCRADATSELECELFRAVPGALGALGLVTELELELRGVSPNAEVVVEVLEARESDPLPVVRSYVERVNANRSDGFRPWSEGIGLVFFGSPSRGASVVVGRRLGGRLEPSRSTLPLFRESRAANVVVQAFSHRFPAVARALAGRLLRPGKSFRARYYPWTFFQSSHDECALTLARRKPLFFDALGLDSELGLVHQAWVVGTSGLAEFVALVSETFERAEYQTVVDALEFFDVLPLPGARSPFDACALVGGDGHVATLSLAVRDRDGRVLAEAWCRHVSEAARERGLPVVVQLNKQHHVSPETLRAPYRRVLDELRRLRTAVDPDRLLGSRTLERLGL
jgi:hypothetical protein